MKIALSLNRNTRGFTLIELMLSTLIAALLISGALRLLIQARIAWQTAENLAALEERAAYALTALEQDIRLAGYWGKHSDGSALAIQADVAAHCGGADVSGWALELSSPAEADNGTFALPCASRSGHVNGTDTLTIRHASQYPATLHEGRIQIYTNHKAGFVLQRGAPPAIPADSAEIYNVEVNAWHVGRNSSEAGLPALRRFALVDGGIMQSQEIVPGVENFQVTLGIDRDGDGAVDGFVNPDAAAGNPVLAVRFWLLLRSAATEPGHIDSGPWHSIDTSAGLPLRPGDGYRRISAERTVWLRNLASS